MSEEPKQTKEAYCPNCQKPSIREGNKIICERCDATFTIIKTGGAKVKDIGRLNSLEDRMDRVESLLPGQEPEPEPDEPVEPEESSILGD